MYIDQEKNSGRIYHVLIVYGSSVAGVCWFGTGPCQKPHILVTTSIIWLKSVRHV